MPPVVRLPAKIVPGKVPCVDILIIKVTELIDHIYIRVLLLLFCTLIISVVDLRHLDHESFVSPSRFFK